jgi:hypothetical protein
VGDLRAEDGQKKGEWRARVKEEGGIGFWGDGNLVRRKKIAKVLSIKIAKVWGKI